MFINNKKLDNRDKIHWLIFIFVAGLVSIYLVYFARSVETSQEEILQVLSQIQDQQKEIIEQQELRSITAYLQNDGTATIVTNYGNIEIELLYDAAPYTTTNWVKLAVSDFYDGVRFHRVIPDFMIQTGDPLSKNEEYKAKWGMGGPGYTFPNEVNPESLGLSDPEIAAIAQQGFVFNPEVQSVKHTRGVLSMANSGPGSNGSQFFIVTTTETPWLNGKHTVFGKVISGLDVVDAIEKVENEGERGGFRPVENVQIEDIVFSDGLALD
jgi:peptidyl-prolyl cis-trans isomerase B (cyclophilin B)